MVTESHYEFAMPDGNITVTPLSALIQYNIIYNNIEGAYIAIENPDSYNIETPTFTLNSPIKT
jgi:hypothetical protein